MTQELGVPSSSLVGVPHCLRRSTAGFSSHSTSVWPAHTELPLPQKFVTILLTTFDEPSGLPQSSVLSASAVHTRTWSGEASDFQLFLPFSTATRHTRHDGRDLFMTAFLPLLFFCSFPVFVLKPSSKPSMWVIFKCQSTARGFVYVVEASQHFPEGMNSTEK